VKENAAWCHLLPRRGDQLLLQLSLLGPPRAGCVEPGTKREPPKMTMVVSCSSKHITSLHVVQKVAEEAYAPHLPRHWRWKRRFYAQEQHTSICDRHGYVLYVVGIPERAGCSVSIKAPLSVVVESAHRVYHQITGKGPSRSRHRSCGRFHYHPPILSASLTWAGA
jgi:hypothetical protein